MTSFDFTTTTHAKWILAGEHAVLRGVSALVYPLKQYQMQLNYQACPSVCEAQFSGEGEDWQMVIHGVLDKGAALCGHASNDISGKFIIHNEIPLGVGLGGSAALCVAIARWFAWQQWIAQDSTLEFARQLENLFHRDSSGIDIAGANAEQGIIYHRNNPIQKLSQRWQPQWYLSYSEQIGVTSHAVKQVQQMHINDREQAELIDKQMQAAVDGAKDALHMDEAEGIAALLKAINQARVCFKRWGLTDGKLSNHMQELSDAGAVACKPTGSGNGGYVLSLWTDAPKDARLIHA